MYTYGQKEHNLVSGIFFNFFPTTYFKQGLSLYLVLTDADQLTGWQDSQSTSPHTINLSIGTLFELQA